MCVWGGGGGGIRDVCQFFMLILHGMTHKLETVGAMRAFGYVVQQWTVSAHFEQDNDGCWMAHSNQVANVSDVGSGCW